MFSCRLPAYSTVRYIGSNFVSVRSAVDGGEAHWSAPAIATHKLELKSGVPGHSLGYAGGFAW
ncbi:hypothetical protein A3C20_02715 [Candidatus Kaiserbacteria bacterium RIFCSPHIGHO2_02_FULL_55_25]|uniref:Uncharacterized protein n=1 Tax=Candidatus Kaiserbacteria bacterium RIFCSPHIGHO2_02_FULL_55_25 TaxID=1798498 RepID=A0A1F6E722_9BACT|nr:MAG: hypothetical protein A3C20_02715 [Candidatus Kaiserbacteria bacterium RIFCSPHIGHO2_02_FULL_55_25]OGG77130.1 MAG: hypothetical protein A3F56_04660 [Candidatus Kaiserbacteria bacterium RIFCSPHIGHO2_12_FULL_55_13]OGG83384.1 MAG: hypothetical protein A3A42_04185 [Candidatus Kaiserbacteria bacterium RIFCSPLOWO2_01_FULL_55_25]